MRDAHVDRDLSAYLDRELAPEEQARVDAHLATCDRCSLRLAELRGAVSLMAALPYTRASRSLVPSVTQRWNWLRPVRSLSMLASGAFLFVFVLTGVARTGIGGASAPAAPQLNAPAVSAAVGVGGVAEATAIPRAAPAAQPTPAPTAAAAPAFGPIASAQQRSTAATAAPSAVLDAQKRGDAASPGVASASQDGVLRAVARTDESTPNPLLDPFVWLKLSLVAATLGILAHVGLRSA